MASFNQRALLQIKIAFFVIGKERERDSDRKRERERERERERGTEMIIANCRESGRE